MLLKYHFLRGVVVCGKLRQNNFVSIDMQGLWYKPLGQVFKKEGMCPL